MSTIVTIVEGPGEVEAIPILIRRIAAVADPGAVPHVPRPIRVKRDSFLKENELERYVDFAGRQTGPGGGVLIVLDADDDCPPELASTIHRRATKARGDCLIKVVLARREYESWFLAAADSIGGRRGLPDDITAPDHVESIRNAKGWLTSRMPTGRAYKETRDQPALTSLFDLDTARRKAPSFAKMWRTVTQLL